MARMSEIPPELLDEMTPAVRAFVEVLLLRIADLEQQNAELRKRVEELEAKLAKNSRNSSKPPSTEHPHAKPPPKKKPKSKRKPGGQRGHQKFERTLIPTDQCEDVVPCQPGKCRGCGKTLRGRDKQPLRQQVWDVEIRPVVTEYQQHRLKCRCCGITTCGTLPDSVDGRTGPVLASILVLLTSWFRTSRRKAALFASDICDVPCSAGHVSALEAKAANALEPIYNELAELLPDQSNLAIDETPFKRGRLKTWLWTFLSDPEVEPTNNAGERSLRHGVIWRKLSFGTQSERGDRFVETLLTIIETCRQQSRNVLQFLTDALRQTNTNRPPPSLLLNTP